jgi:hypothetical protein
VEQDAKKQGEGRGQRTALGDGQGPQLRLGVRTAKPQTSKEGRVGPHQVRAATTLRAMQTAQVVPAATGAAALLAEGSSHGAHARGHVDCGIRACLLREGSTRAPPPRGCEDPRVETAKFGWIPRVSSPETLACESREARRAKLTMQMGGAGRRGDCVRGKSVSTASSVGRGQKAGARVIHQAKMCWHAQKTDIVFDSDRTVPCRLGMVV